MVSGRARRTGRLAPISVGVELMKPDSLGAIAEVREGAEDKLLRLRARRRNLAAQHRSSSRCKHARSRIKVENRCARARCLAAFRVQLTPVYDQAALVDESIRSVRDAILIGIALCVAVIALFPCATCARVLRHRCRSRSRWARPSYPWDPGPEPESHVARRPRRAIGLVIDDAIVVIEAIGKRVQEGVPPRMLSAGDAHLLAALSDHRDHVVVFLPLGWLQGVSAILLGFGDDAFDGGSHLLGGCPDHVPLAARQWLRPRPKSHAAVTLHRNLRSHGAPLLKRPWIGLLVAVRSSAWAWSAPSSSPLASCQPWTREPLLLDYLPAGTSLVTTDRLHGR